MGKLSHTVVKNLAQGHIASQWQCQDLKPGLLTLEPCPVLCPLPYFTSVTCPPVKPTKSPSLTTAFLLTELRCGLSTS